MFRFQRHAPPDLMLYSPPPVDHRDGPPLSQGFVLTLINTVAAEHCTPEMKTWLDQVDPNGWYHGQLLETVLNTFEDLDPDLPNEIGKNIYYTLQTQFAAMGIRTPDDVITTMPGLWQHVTRGDAGYWRIELCEPGHARLEGAQPFNCLFEHGAVHGAMEAFDAVDVQITHEQCMRRGDRSCMLDVRWNVEAT